MAFGVGSRVHRGLDGGSLGVMNLFNYYLSLAFATLTTFGATFLADGEQLPKTFLLLVTLIFVNFLK